MATTPSTSRSALLQQARWPAVIAAACWSGLAFYFSTAGNAITPFAWIAPVPILAFVFAGPRDGGRWGRIAAGAFLAASAGNLAWAVLYWGILPALPLVALALLLGAAFAAVVWLTALVSSRLGTLAGILAFPTLWVVVEFALARWSPHGTAGSVAYTQVDILPLLQLTAWAGLAGVTFVLLLAAAGLAAALGDRSEKGMRWSLVVLPLLVLIGALVAGQVRILRTSRAGRVTVGLVSSDEDMRFSGTTSRDEAVAVLMRYLVSAGDLAVRRADAVVMPEKMVGVTASYEPEVTSLLSSLSEKDEILIVAGLNKTGREDKRNVASLFARGRRALEYEKRRLVPGLEAGYAQGGQSAVYRAPGGVTGVAICKDLDFPEIGREYGRAGVGVLFVPAWDFVRDARLHSRMAVVRGVESGYSVARAAANGLLTGSDYLGRVIAESPSDAAPQSMLLVELPLGRGHTFYSEHGDWFAWLCVLAAAGLLLAAGARAQ